MFLWQRVILSKVRFWAGQSVPKLIQLQDSSLPKMDRRRGVNTPTSSHLGGKFWNVLTIICQGSPASLYLHCLSSPPCATSAPHPHATREPLPNKLHEPKSLSQGLFGDQWQFILTIYDPEPIIPSTIEHGWFFFLSLWFFFFLNSLCIFYATQ